jgi:hypothetical protein
VTDRIVPQQYIIAVAQESETYTFMSAVYEYISVVTISAVLRMIRGILDHTKEKFGFERELAIGHKILIYLIADFTLDDVI